MSKRKTKIVRKTHDLSGAAVPMLRNLLARYDAAQTTDENSRHWANADLLSANSANDPATRRTLRSRARYEYANNCYCNGMVRTLASHVIGTGPRIQLLTESADSNREIEVAFADWSKQVRLAAKLHTVRQARCRDGEAFALLVQNPRLTGRVRLYPRIMEADQCATPAQFLTGYYQVDGLEIDQFGDPAFYHLLRNHPGETSVAGFGEYDRVPAHFVIHLYREERPGQRRGVPEITPALPLYAVLRRYTLATLHKAEIAALMAVFLKTTASGFDPADLGDPFQLMNLERNAMTTLPEGWDISQLKAEAPTDAHDAFTKAILREIARCLDMPFNIAAGDSSSYNYSSGRLDHQTYFRAIEIDRKQFEIDCLDRLFAAWLSEYLGESSGIHPRDIDTSRYPHEWRWDGYEHVDPLKEANANETMLRTGQVCLPDLIAKQGGDWEVLQAKAAAAFGLSIEDYRARLADAVLGGKAPAAFPGQLPGGAVDAEAEDEDNEDGNETETETEDATETEAARV